MERPRTLDPRKCKNNIRHLIGTDNSQLNTHIILLAPNTIQHHLVVHINLALVLVNGPLAIITPLLDAINHHFFLLLSHVLIAIEIDLSLTQEITLILNINLISIFLNNQLPIFIILPQRNPILKSICIIQTPPYVFKVQKFKLMLSLLLLAL